jgi:hypothetical protein
MPTCILSQAISPWHVEKGHLLLYLPQRNAANSEKDCPAACPNGAPSISHGAR